MKKLLTHKHTAFDIIIDYYQDRPAQVRTVLCTVCGEHNEILRRLYQEREDENWKLCGSKSSLTWLNKDIRWVEEKTRYSAEELKNKDFPV